MTAATSTTEEMVGAHRDTALWEWVLVIVLALIPALPLLFGSGLINTRAGGDSPFLLVRVHQMVLNIRAGVFPARWMPQAAYGLGYPFFNFYASLPYYLAAVLKLAGVGYIWAIKLTQALGFVFAALAIYGFSKELGCGPAASLLVALAYSCAPFHMVNVYVRGDSLSEFYAFVFFPLILWTLLRMHRQANRKPRFLRENRVLALDVRNLTAVALSYAGLMLTHNISALIFSPLVLVYALWLAWVNQDRLRCTISSLLALGAGALVSAWFWLPALAERDNVYLQDMTTGYFNYVLHFRGLDLVQRSLAFDYAITADRQPFRMGLVQAALAVAGLMAVVVWWIRRRRVESHSAFCAFLLAISTFMITPLSRPLWDHLPLLPIVQFPWRFLSLQAFAASLILAYLVPRRQRQGLLIAFLLGMLVLITMLLRLNPERLLIQEADINAQRLMLYEYFTANVGTTIRTDYLPRWVDPRPYTSEAFWHGGVKPAPLTIEGQAASANLIALGPTSERWAIEVTSSQSLLAFHTYYYPGWEARVDGQPAKIEALPGLGYIGLRLSQGHHEVYLRLGRTRVRFIAEVLSALAVGVLLFLLLRERRFRPHVLGIIAVALAVLVLLVLRCNDDDELVEATSVAPSASATTEVVATGPPTQSAGMMTGLQPEELAPTDKLDLTMDFDRIPYLHHNPGGIRFGNTSRLIYYELSSQAIQAGETLTVTMYWDNISRNDLVTKVAVVSPAQHLFAIPQAVAISEEPLTGDYIRHVLRIPASTVRGIYLLSVQVYNSEGEIRPITPQGETLGTTYLLPVRISGEILASSDEPIVQKFGECIALSRVQTVQQMAGTLEVTLTWRAFAPAPQNYKVALRLKDAGGWDVARLDTQPGYGFYPTSMWRPGEMVNDCCVLLLDDGTPPGTQYNLDITLYEAASLRPIGTATIPNVVISHPTVRRGYKVLHQFGLAIALHEAQLPKVELEQGAELAMLLKWAATVQVDRDYECRVALLDLARTVVISQAMPLDSGYASSLWPQNAIVASHYELQLDRDLPAGQYTIALTVIEALSKKEVGTFILPTAIHVTEARRNYAIPRMQQPVGADFAEQIRLLGYDLQRTEKELALTLHWQALAEMDTDYKIFVHLFDPVTEKIVAQRDVLAGGDSHPTRRWVPKEVVSSSIALPLEGVPSGVYRLAIGLYHPSGRLPVIAPPDFTVSADRLWLNGTISIP